MPTYRAQCTIGTNGRQRRRTIAAPSAQIAIARLRLAGLFASKVTEQKPAYQNSRIPRRYLIKLFGELHKLLGVKAAPSDQSHDNFAGGPAHGTRYGLDLLQALQLLSQTFPYKPLRIILADIHERCASSTALTATAFATYPRTFTPDIVAQIAAASRGGAPALAKGFKDIHDRLARRANDRARLIAVLGYPVSLICGTMALMVYADLKFLPSMEALVEVFHGKMPPLTHYIFLVADYGNEHWLLILAVLVSPALLFALLRRWPIVALGLDRFSLHLPYYGPFRRHLLTEEFAATYAMQYSNGRDAPEILQQCAATTGNLYARHTIQKMYTWVAFEGLTPAQAFKKAGLFSAEAVMTFSRGAATGTTSEAMTDIVEFSKRYADESSAHFFTFLRYAGLLTAALIVGLVVYGLIIPMYQVPAIR